VNLAMLDAAVRSQPQRTVQRLDASLAAHPLASIPERDRPYGLLAQAYALAGRPDKARAVLGQFAAIKDSAFYRARESEVHEALGEIALAEKRYADAVREFRRADVAPDGKPVNEDAVRINFDLGRSFDLANQPDSAIAQLEAYVNDHYYSRNDDDPIALAGTLKRLGELYDAKGDRNKAISYLTRFVDLWKNADPDLQPLVADAKRRITKLQAGSKG
jgi:tetratricopeptide (TPR) repeat protein